MSYQPQTSQQWHAELNKFKRAKPEYNSGTSGIHHQKWNNEFLNLKLREAWRQGMLDAKGIIEDCPDTDDPRQDFCEAIDEAIEENETPPLTT